MDERYLLAGGLEALGRLLIPRNSRVRTGLMTHPLDGSLDDLLVQVPAAARSHAQGNNEPALGLLKTTEGRIKGLQNAVSYGADIEGHHPVSLLSAYLAASDLSVPDARRFYDEGDRLGLEFGTRQSFMLPVTRLAHDYAHLDPVTAKTNKNAFATDAMRFRQEDPIARANAWAPMAQLEACISKQGYSLPEEQKVRQIAAEIVGAPVELLHSGQINPNYVTPTGRQGNLSYAASHKKVLTEDLMDCIKGIAYGDQTVMKDLIQPNYYKHEFKKKPAEYRERRSKDPVFDHSVLRPGQRELLETLAL